LTLSGDKISSASTFIVNLKINYRHAKKFETLIIEMAESQDLAGFEFQFGRWKILLIVATNIESWFSDLTGGERSQC